VAHLAGERRRPNATGRRQHLDRKVAPNADPVLGPIFDSNSPATQWNILNDWGHVLDRGLAMGIGHPPHNKRDRHGVLLRAADSVAPPRQWGDEFCDGSSSLPVQAATFPGDKSPRQGIHNVLSLREENARLRALAVKLSNIVGDLPVREWEDAVAAGADGSPLR
jgi:hypothetical protein